jgi:hypothetical protein
MIKKMLYLSFFICTNAHAAELILSGGPQMVRSSIYGQEDTPSYTGKGFFLEAEYYLQIGRTYAFSLFGVHHKSKLEDTVDSTIREDQINTYYGIGLKIYSGVLFFSGSVGQFNFENKASGTSNVTVSSSEGAFEFGAGLAFRLTNSIGITFAAFALNTSLNPENGKNFSEDYDLWQFRAVAGISFTLPSNIPLVRN